MTHYTNTHTFKQHPSVCTNKSIKLRLSYSFLDFIPTTTDLPSINLSDQEKMMELEQQNEIDSEALGSTKYKSGLIFLHGLGGRTELKDLLKYISGPALGLSMSKNKIVTPKAPRTSVAIFPPSFIPGGLTKIRSWFNFWLKPAASVISPVAGESKSGLKVAMKWVEEEIEKMIAEGIPSENIVLTGLSQGGALTLYTALHTKYKIGGFIPIVAWQPLLKIEPPTSLPIPTNKDTPIFHLNGKLDPIVPLICGWKTSKAFKQVFTQYNLKMVVGTHTTSINRLTIPKIYCWLKNNVPGMAFSKVSPLRFLDCNKGNLFSFLVDY